MTPIHTPKSFWAKVKKQPSGCWEWQGSTNKPNGYGAVHWNKKPYGAHRVAAYLSGLVTQLEAPLNRKASGFVLHTCDNKLCCNPAHLYVGSYSENLHDAYKTGAKKPAKGVRKNSKLNPTTVKQIFTKCKQNFSLTSIAELYGVSYGMVGHIKNGRKWAHITKELLT